MIIHIPNRSIIAPDDPVSAVLGMSGRFKIEKLKVDAHGNVIEASREVVAEFSNLITDQGLNRVGTASDWLNACQIGTGSAAPLVTDTGLTAYLAGSTTIRATTLGAQASAPFFGWQRRTFRFAAGVGTGNLSEVGVGWASTGSNLFSKALILDAGLNPTTITKLADEVLDVTYEFRNHPPTADVTGNVTITGSGSHAFVTRAADVTSGPSAWAGAGIGGIENGFNSAFSGAIGAVTSSPGGSSSNASSSDRAAYTNNSYQRAGTITFGLNDGNVGGLRSLRHSYGLNLGWFQTEFTPVIAKDETKTLTFNVNHVWARRP